MTKVIWCVIVLSAFAIGVAAGAYGMLRFGIEFLNEGIVASNTATAAVTVRTLEAIKAGDIKKGTELLEQTLDGALVSLWGQLRSEPVAKRDAHVLRAVRLAKEYRAAHPHPASSPEGGQALDEVFSMVQLSP